MKPPQTQGHALATSLLQEVRGPSIWAELCRVLDVELLKLQYRWPPTEGADREREQHLNDVCRDLWARHEKHLAERRHRR